MADKDSIRFGHPADPEAATEAVANPASISGVARANHGTVRVPTGGDSRPLRAATKLHGDRFEVRRPIGKGGMGAVYEVFDNERQVVVALKVVGWTGRVTGDHESDTGGPEISHVELTGHVDPVGAYRFKQEFRSLADVVHPNLVRLHELFTVRDRWFFTMDLVAGVDFVEATRSSDPRRRELRDAFAQLVDGVMAIHAAGKLHCDIKPSNVLVTPEGRVVILDFGLITDVEAGGMGRTVDDGSIAGTPSYMAPERAIGAQASPASDVYAMGVMLFEALTGQLPFRGSMHAQLKQKLDAPFPRPSSLKLDIPQDLDDLCVQMCDRDPAARPQASEVRAVLGPATRSSVPPSRTSDVPVQRAILIGRERELAVLNQAYEQARSGEPTVVLLSGESGIGKTALVTAFLAELSAQGQAVVLPGRCYERESIPYKAFDAIVDELTRYLRRHGDAALGLLPRDVSALARLFPVLNRVPVVANAPDRSVAGPQQQHQAFAALEELLGRIRDRQPLVLLIDDLQWADQDSVDLLAYLFSRSGAGAWLWILDYRAEEVGRNPVLDRIVDMLAASKTARAELLPIGPLLPEAAEALARSLNPSSSREQIASVARESGGIPLFVAELVRYVQARGEIEGAAASLTEALQSRIEQLEPAERDLLEVVSVASRPLPRNVLLEASQDRDAAHRVLDGLLFGHLLRISGLDAGRRVETYHDRIRETVTALLPSARSQDIHRRLVRALLGSSEPDPEHLTLHLEGAGESQQAAEQAIVAAERANRVLAFERAAQLYAHAMELGCFEAEPKRQLTIRLADALANAGRSHDAAAAYLGAVAGAESNESQELRRRAAEELMISGRAEQGFAVMSTMLVELGLAPVRGGVRSMLSLVTQRALLRARGLGYRARPREQIDALQLRRMDVCWACARGLTLVDQVQGADFAARYLRLALNAGDEGSVGRGLALESAYHANFGEEAMAEPLMSRARAIADASSDPFLKAWVGHFSAVNDFQRADYPAAIEGLERALIMYQEQCSGAIWESTSARSFLAWALWHKGDYQRLRELLLSAVQDANSRGDLLGSVTMSTGTFGSAWLIRDEVDEVVRYQRVARETWPSIIYDLQRALTMLGDVLLDFYRGNDLDPWPRFDAEWPMLRNAPIMRNHIARSQFLYARAECALVAARIPANQGSRSKELVAIAGACARELAKVKQPVARGYAGIVAASVACAQGDSAAAVAGLSRAVEAFELQGSAMLAAAARARLGALLGGDEGRRLITQTDDFMRSQSVLRPDRIITMLTPACELLRT